jgi:hypothetical protein
MMRERGEGIRKISASLSRVSNLRGGEERCGTEKFWDIFHTEGFLTREGLVFGKISGFSHDGGSFSLGSVLTEFVMNFS